MVLNQSSLTNQKNMKAQDLFKENYVQVFSKKNGNYLGTVIMGSEINFPEYEEVQAPDKEINNINQLSMF